MPQDPRIYSATYSNVPVYEYNVEGNHVMRRRADDWINATHILKVADFDKPARTRILEREVQKGVHEKVQGGYGKYQGTWVPLPDGRMLAQRNGVLDKLLAIFDFVPGDRSPPPAPKHATATSNKPRAPRQTAASRRVPVPPRVVEEEHFETASIPYIDENETPDNVTIISESLMDGDEMYGSQYTNSRKRKRGGDQMSAQDREHQIWADQLLDYFMLLETEDRFPAAPEPPPGVDIDRPIDEKGHSAMHWAAAMGDVEVVKDLIRRGARTDCLSNNLETPLMRAVLFTNNYDKDTMPRMVRLLQQTVVRSDWYGSTVFHHITRTTENRNKYLPARYYLDTIINVLSETWIPEEVTKLLNQRDHNGDTAVMIAARNGARKCVRSLLGRNVAVDIPNSLGETADDLIRELNSRRRERGRHNRGASSSPFAPDGRSVTGLNGDLASHHSSHHHQLSASAVGSSAGPLAALMTPTRRARYKSQTAHTLVSKMAPDVVERLSQLADACEAELDEKDAEAADAARVARKRQAEIDALRRQINDLGPLVGGLGLDGEIDEVDARLEDELAELVREGEALLELEQLAELGRLVASSGDSRRQANGGGDINEKIQLAHALAAAQEDRRELVREVVQGLAAAGVGDKHSEYKRLIVGALGVREEDVESVLSDVLRQLEEEREMEVGEGESPV